MTHPNEYSFAWLLLAICILTNLNICNAETFQGPRNDSTTRPRMSLNSAWRFACFTSTPDSLSYDKLNAYILPTANDFLSGNKYQRPTQAAPESDIEYVQPNFDNKAWDQVDLPHDWAITETFDAPGVGGGLGGLPNNGVGWYQRTLSFHASVITLSPSTPTGRVQYPSAKHS